MLSSEQGEKVVKYARDVVEAKVRGEELPQTPDGEFFQEKKGVFVTLKKNDDLRGCIGITQAEFSLSETVQRAGTSVTNDPRFPPLQEDELQAITVEVTVLTEPEEIQVENPEEYPEKIEIGRDGLLLKRGRDQGLLLPQVPVEQDWNVDEFLRGTCRKAGLHPNAWTSGDVKLYKFQGQIFGEKQPHGEVERREF